MCKDNQPTYFLRNFYLLKSANTRGQFRPATLSRKDFCTHVLHKNSHSGEAHKMTKGIIIFQESVCVFYYVLQDLIDDMSRQCQQR
jgi:hypothetical protein